MRAHLQSADRSGARSQAAEARDRDRPFRCGRRHRRGLHPGHPARHGLHVRGHSGGGRAGAARDVPRHPAVPALLVTLPAIAWLWVSGDGSTTSNIIFTIYLGIAGMADNVLKPLLLGRGVDAPMLVILIGALGGMVTGGIIGLFVGAVLLAVGYQLFMEWVDAEPIPHSRSRPAGSVAVTHGSKSKCTRRHGPYSLAALVLSACVTLGPDYKEPDVAWLNEWQSDLYGQLGQPGAADPDRPAFLDAAVQRTRAERPDRDGATRESVAAHRRPANPGKPGLARHRRQQPLSAAAAGQRRGRLRGRTAKRRIGPAATRASPAIRPASTLAGNWISGDASAAASNRPTPRILRVHHQPAGRAGAAERAGGGPVLRLPHDVAADRDRRSRTSRLQKRSLEITETDIQGGPGIGARPAAGEDAIPGHAGDHSGPGSDAGPGSAMRLPALLGRTPGDMPELASVGGPNCRPSSRW